LRIVTSTLGRTGERPSITATERCGSHRCADRGEGAVSLERRKRLDRLAEPLLIGQERATGVERVADSGPLIRRQLTAEQSCHSRDRLSVIGARAPDRVRRFDALGSKRLDDLQGAAGDLHLMTRDERVELLRDPWIQWHHARSVRARKLFERRADLRIPHNLEPQLLAIDAAEVGEPRRWRLLAQLQDRYAALGGGIESR
jgi:hypothetical protein